MLGPPLASPLRVAVGVALLALVGLLALAAVRAADGRGWRLRDGLEDLALAWVAGQAATVPLLMLAGLAGLPLRGRPIALLLAGVAAAGAVAALVLRRRRRRLPPASPPAASPSAASPSTASPSTASPSTASPPTAPAGGVELEPARASRATTRPSAAALLWAGRAVAAGALLLALYKLVLVPLWSWDHFAIWGLKARLLSAEGGIVPEVLARFDLVHTVPHYPLGVPLAWLAATLGAMPPAAVFHGFHLGWLVALVVLVHAAARRLAGSRLVALAAAAFVAASPLAWDSVHLGLADLPLALFAVAAVAAAAAAIDGGGEGGRGRAGAPGGWALAGLFVGFLPWVKSEGASIAALLALALAAWRWQAGGRGRARDLGAFAVPAALSGGVAVAIGRLLLPKGQSFFGGGPFERLAWRLQAPWEEVLAPVLGELGGGEWLGLWAALPVVLAVAVRRRLVPALALVAAVLLQLSIYVAVFFTTHLPAADHVATALHRIAAALLPLAVLAAAALAAERPAARSFSRRVPT